MTSSWKDVNERLSYFLDDRLTSRGTNTTTYMHAEPLRIAAWNWSQKVFQAHTRREMTTTLTIGTDGRSATLPVDCLDVVMIYEPTSGYIYGRKLFEQKGQRRADAANYAYWVWGDVLKFDRSVTETVTLEYLARWPEVTFDLDSDDNVVIKQNTIYIPDWAELPLMHLTAATVLQPQAIQAAITRTSNIKIDSGVPEDNSRRVQATDHWLWYKRLIGEVEPQVRNYGR